MAGFGAPEEVSVDCYFTFHPPYSLRVWGGVPLAPQSHAPPRAAQFAKAKQRDGRHGPPTLRIPFAGSGALRDEVLPGGCSRERRRAAPRKKLRPRSSFSPQKEHNAGPACDVRPPCRGRWISRSHIGGLKISGFKKQGSMGVADDDLTILLLPAKAEIPRGSVSSSYFFDNNSQITDKIASRLGHLRKKNRVHT